MKRNGTEAAPGELHRPMHTFRLARNEHDHRPNSPRAPRPRTRLYLIHYIGRNGSTCVDTQWADHVFEAACQHQCLFRGAKILTLNPVAR